MKTIKITTNNKKCQTVEEELQISLCVLSSVTIYKIYLQECT